MLTEILIGYAVEDGLCIETASFTGNAGAGGGPRLGRVPLAQRPAADSRGDNGVPSDRS